MKVEFVRKGSLAEIYYGGGLTFSLLERIDKDHYRGLNTPAYCKDFFTDSFWSEINQQPTSIHGFNWKPGTIDPKAPYFYMAVQHKGMSVEAKRIQSLMNLWEKRFGFASTRCYQVGDNTVVVEFPNEWTTRPVMISFATLLMRLGPAYDGSDPITFLKKIAKEGNKYGQFDKQELGKKEVIPYLEKCWESKSEPHPNQTYEQYKQASNAHHSGGLIAFTTGRATG